MPMPRPDPTADGGPGNGIQARPTGRRSDRLHERVLQATAELLDEGGYPAATIDAIVTRSGVAKATVYNHWPSRTAVAANAFGRMMAQDMPLVDTGTFAGDIAAHMRAVSAFYDSPRGQVFAQLLAACVEDPAGAAYFREYFLDHRHEAVIRLWQRGLDRGEADPEIDVEDFIDLLAGPLVFRKLAGHRPLTAERADRLAAAILAGVQTGKHHVSQPNKEPS
jgi:AcrR family transcriptional regulator